MVLQFFGVSLTCLKRASRTVYLRANLITRPHDSAEERQPHDTKGRQVRFTSCLEGKASRQTAARGTLSNVKCQHFQTRMHGLLAYTCTRRNSMRRARSAPRLGTARIWVLRHNFAHATSPTRLATAVQNCLA